MWVPLVENNEHDKPGADYFVKQHIERILQKSATIDTILLACTHYPLLAKKVREFLPSAIQLVSQGEIVAQSLVDYLQRHPEMAGRISTGRQRKFYTTDDAADFEQKAGIFYGKQVKASRIEL